MSMPVDPLPIKVDDDETNKNLVPAGMSRFVARDALPPQPPWERLSDRVICVLGKNPGTETLNGTNCYLVGTGPKRLLIDTGGGEAKGVIAGIDVLQECMRLNGCRELQAIIITHLHFDHFGGVEEIQKRMGPGIPVYQRETVDAYWKFFQKLRERNLLQYFLKDGEAIYTPFDGVPPPPLPDNIDLSWTWRDRGSVHISFWYMWNAYKHTQKLRLEYDWRRLDDNDVIRTEGATLRCMHCPGHTDDHCVFVLVEEHALFSGDAVLGHGTTWVYDLHEYMLSLRRMRDVRSVRIYPAHGPVIEDGTAVIDRYIEHREAREEQTWQALQNANKKGPVSAADLAKVLYPQASPSRLKQGAIPNVLRVLRKFEKDGSVHVYIPSSTTSELIPVHLPTYVRQLSPSLLWSAKGRDPTRTAHL